MSATLARAVVAAWLAVAIGGAAAVAATAPGPAPLRSATGNDATTSGQVRQALHWVKRSGDHGAAPFIIIDKRQARLWIFDALGAPMMGDTPVLLGLATGDRSVAGIGEREMADIAPHERTTPAGRFVAEPGRNAGGEDIFWLDYDAAVSMHRVRTTRAADRRLQRLASPSPADNRISYGCVNVPAAFYDERIRPVFSARRGLVYVLPETLPLPSVFSGLDPAHGAR